NFATITAFLAWFGGAGYLLSRFSSIWALLAFGMAALAGLGGAWLVFWFLVKVLIASERELNAADFEMVGGLGTISSTVFKGGTGEMMCSQAGVRRAASVRSEDGRSLAKGMEVVVTRYENGVAYARPWEEMNGGS